MQARRHREQADRCSGIVAFPGVGGKPANHIRPWLKTWIIVRTRWWLRCQVNDIALSFHMCDVCLMHFYWDSHAQQHVPHRQQMAQQRLRVGFLERQRATPAPWRMPKKHELAVKVNAASRNLAL